MPKHLLRAQIGTAEGLDDERLRLAAEQSVAAFTMSTFVLVVACFMLRSQMDVWFIAAAVFVVSSYLARLLLSRRFMANESNRKNQSSWARYFFVSAASSGTSWGIFVMLMVLLRTPESDLMSMFLVVALTTGAIPSLGALSLAYTSYVIGILIPAIAGFAVRGDQFGPTFALLAVGYLLFLAATAGNYRRRLNTWLQHARDNVQLVHYNHHDRLTGLPNKTQFETDIKLAMEDCCELKNACTLLYVDLDQFKIINDTCGHATGDELLQQVAVLLRRLIRRQDLLWRLGGDEFGVLLHGCSLEQANQLATVLCRSIKQHRFFSRDRNFRLTASVGLAMCGSRADSLLELLSAAESASYGAKESGRDRVHIYNPDDTLLHRRNQEMHWALEIPEALAAGRFYLEAQAIVAVEENSGAGNWCEVLLRMRNQEGNTVMPGEFLPAAERYNLAARLDIWVIETVLETLARETSQPANLELCFINLSGQSMGDPGFMDKVCGLLNDSPVEPDRLCFEITETAAVDNVTQALALMQRLQGLGCRFALDDFGSGLSSFGYLRDFPVDFIKIDGAFVRDIADDPVNREIVASISQIGHTTNKLIIAEFVENESTLTCLREIGVDYAQGYGIAVPAEFPGPGNEDVPRLLSA